MNWRDWGPPPIPGVLAILSLLGAFAIQILLIFRNEAVDMPPWVVGIVSAVVAFYFGQRSNGNGKNQGGLK